MVYSAIKCQSSSAPFVSISSAPQGLVTYSAIQVQINSGAMVSLPFSLRCLIDGIMHFMHGYMIGRIDCQSKSQIIKLLFISDNEFNDDGG
jgi:hypothetical protein